MKKITLLFVLFSAFIYAQNEPNGTTLEEYNYMTKGYKIQISSGLDMKKGYVIENITKYSTSAYDFDFKNLLRETTKTSAGIILVATSKVWGNVYYLSIPINNDDLLADFNAKIELWDEPMVTAYSNATTSLMSQLFNFYNYNNKLNSKN